MKKIDFTKMLTILAIVLIAFSTQTFATNITWSGGGDGTSWNDGANWAGTVPGASDVAIFGTNATFTITGIQTNVVKGIWLFDGANISFDLDVTVTHTGGFPVKLFAGSALTIGTGNTFDVTAGTNSAFYFNKTGSALTIESGATVNFAGPKGIETDGTSTSATLDNYGILNLNATVAGVLPNAATSLNITNHPCGIINVTNANGTIKIWNSSTSTLTNNGLMTDIGSGACVSVTTGNVVTNNGFFKSGNGVFGAGSGTAIDNGVNVNSTVALDATNGCTVDINGGNTGMQAYTWAGGSALNAANAADGTLDLTGAMFADATGPHTITISDAGCADYNTEFTVTVENVCPAAVPVELTYFRAAQEENVNVLEWETATEENNSHFEVERSTNGIDFEQIGMIEGFGTTYEVQNYTFVDEKPTAVSYYRLRQVDFDGQFEYTKVVMVEQEMEYKDIAVYPTPVLNQLTIEYIAQTTEDVTVSVVDMTGRVITTQNNITIEGENRLNVDFSILPQGAYFVKVQSKNVNFVRTVVK